MVKNKTTNLTNYYYPEKIPHFGINTYDYCEKNLRRPWYKKTQFDTLHIDLEQTEEGLLSTYHYNARLAIKKSQDYGFIFKTHESALQFQKLQKSVVEGVEDVGYYPEAFFKKDKSRLFTTIESDEHGVVAFHGHLIDRDDKIALSYMNISTFRSHSDTKTQRLIGYANKHLFHLDFLHFKSMGMNTYDLGGISLPSLKEFKSQFGGEERTYYRYVPFFI